MEVYTVDKTDLTWDVPDLQALGLTKKVDRDRICLNVSVFIYEKKCIFELKWIQI